MLTGPHQPGSKLPGDTGVTSVAPGAKKREWTLSFTACHRNLSIEQTGAGAEFLKKKAGTVYHEGTLSMRIYRMYPNKKGKY